jgi:PKHD-type hydroxylase
MILEYQFSQTKRVFNDTELVNIIAMGERNLEDAKIDSTEQAIQGHRNSSIAWFKRKQETEFIFSRVLNMIAGENKNNHWNYDYDAVEDLQFTKYDGQKKQHYNWHADQRSLPYDNKVDEILRGKIRKISFSILLNEDYDGGNFEFETGLPHEENRITTLTPSTGCAIVFPSFMYHRVTPVTKGVRYSLVGWICGRPFR